MRTSIIASVLSISVLATSALAENVQAPFGTRESYSDAKAHLPFKVIWANKLSDSHYAAVADSYHRDLPFCMTEAKTNGNRGAGFNGEVDRCMRRHLGYVGLTGVYVVPIT